MHASTLPAGDICTAMMHSHENLEVLYTDLLCAMESNAPDIRAIWDRFDLELIAHFETEERLVLPRFALFDPNEARSLLREHGVIREQLLEIGVAIELRQCRYARALELVEMHRAHASREELLLHRWADHNLEAARADDALRAGANP
jgi:hypothetical protein